MLEASPLATRQSLDYCCDDDMLNASSDRQTHRLERDARRARERGINGRLSNHDQILLDRTLRSHEEQALRRGLKVAQVYTDDNNSQYTNKTRAIFVISLILITIGIGVGVTFIVANRLLWLIVCAGLLSLGFGLLGFAARRGASEIQAQ